MAPKLMVPKDQQENATSSPPMSPKMGDGVDKAAFDAVVKRMEEMEKKMVAMEKRIAQLESQ